MPISLIVWHSILDEQPCRDVEQLVFLDAYGIFHSGQPCWGTVNDDVPPEEWYWDTRDGEALRGVCWWAYYPSELPETVMPCAEVAGSMAHQRIAENWVSPLWREEP